jgi:G3E family GTPase
MTIVAGALGSGKTTLLKALIDGADRRLAVVMNEFGEVAVDGRTIQGRDVALTELTGGCVCCSLLGEFEAAVVEIIDRTHPDLILVETTGVAEPDALVFGIEEELDSVRLDGVITVADADGMLRFPELGRITRTQFEAADIVVVSKVDLVAPADVGRVEADIAGLNPRAIRLRAVKGRVDPVLLLGPGSRPQRTGVTGAGPVAQGHDVTSFAFRTSAAMDGDLLRASFDDLPERVYRAKGFALTAGGGLLVNYVAGRLDLEEADCAQTELVFIGREVDRVQEEVLGRLKACTVG